jgi:hypothetical protein
LQENISGEIKKANALMRVFDDFLLASNIRDLIPIKPCLDHALRQVSPG